MTAIDIPDAEYQQLAMLARGRAITVEAAATDAIRHWIVNEEPFPGIGRILDYEHSRPDPRGAHG